MKKGLHQESKLIKFHCVACSNEVELYSTLKEDMVSMDVCNKCHPVYIGGPIEQKIKGKGEKYAARFEAGRNSIDSKNDSNKKNIEKKQNKKIIKSLEEL